MNRKIRQKNKKKKIKQSNKKRLSKCKSKMKTKSHFKKFNALIPLYILNLKVMEIMLSKKNKIYKKLPLF